MTFEGTRGQEGAADTWAEGRPGPEDRRTDALWREGWEEVTGTGAVRWGVSSELCNVSPPPEARTGKGHGLQTTLGAVMGMDLRDQTAGGTLGRGRARGGRAPQPPGLHTGEAKVQRPGSAPAPAARRDTVRHRPWPSPRGSPGLGSRAASVLAPKPSLHSCSPPPPISEGLAAPSPPPSFPTVVPRADKQSEPLVLKSQEITLPSPGSCRQLDT